MWNRILGTAVALVVGLTGQSMAYYSVSQTVTNTDPTLSWHGLHVYYNCQSPPPIVPYHFDGPFGGPLAGHFYNFGWQSVWSYFRWSNFNDFGTFGGTNVIDPQQSIRVGWTFSDQSAPPFCNSTWMRWEKENGEGYHCAIGTVTPGWSWQPGGGVVIHFANSSDVNIRLDHGCFGVLPNPIPVDDLGPENKGLNFLLEGSLLFDSIDIAPGDSILVEIPKDIQPEDHIVLRFESEDGGHCAEVLTYTVFDVRPGGPTPVQETSWGSLKERFRR